MTTLTFADLKLKLKTLAAEIRDKKSKRKGAPNGVVPGLKSAQYEFRHHHIAYCLLRGRSMEEIEKCAEDNKPSEYYVEQIVKSVPPKVVVEVKEEQNEQALCSC